MARLLPPESAAVDEVSREVGVGAQTLERWLSASLAGGSDRHRGDGQWTRLRAAPGVASTACIRMTCPGSSPT